ncbi:hypothetical protein O7632_22825 [Solwaraspora sp. WMMD406]|uniref:hypothetical protein n=1 Tax=Solwaraspora sp. WMMD406 TaxID=3016095 RepID=UPI0024175232|nr:hypothetical protein [Solwaraspora sp. WMMD406]MDG4766911.1 hypothetical protein [Solwaraspora sp. WMMD406]
MTLRYLGNSPYCAANSLSVIFGPAGPGPATLEVAGGSPFGIAIHGDDIIYFSSPVWRPDFGLDNAMRLAGWECDRIHGNADDSVAILRQATWDAPVLAGPIEMGLLPYVPGLGQAVGADHNLVVIGVEGDMVRGHDVIGWPFVTVPVDALLKTWQGDTFAYPADAYAVRFNFRQTRTVSQDEILRQAMHTAVEQLSAPGIAEAAERAAQLVEGDLSSMQYKYLVEFQVQAGSRRLADAAALYREQGCDGPAAILERQALLVGSLQLLLMTHEYAQSAAVFRELGPTYAQLREAFVAQIGD